MIAGRELTATEASDALTRAVSAKLAGRPSSVMTLADRIDVFKAAFPQWPASWPHLVREQDRDVLYAIWLIGQDYRNKTRYYGAYPAGYLARVMAFFPDVLGSETLHVFSGSLPEGDYLRCDLTQPAELQCHVCDLPSKVGSHLFRLVIADPPYSPEDAKKYETPMIVRRHVMRALADVTHVGGHVVWLDTTWPQFSKRQWVTVGRIAVVRSTNHRIRMTSIFERVA